MLTALFAAIAFAQANPVDKSPDYFVVRIGLAGGDENSARFRGVAGRAAAFHHAETIDYDGRDSGALLAELRKRSPRDVLFVLKPQDLDINLHRSIVSICNRVDDDIFADFSFGYLTARTPEALEALWERTVALREHGLANHTWAQSSITSGQKSLRYEDGASGIKKDAGFGGPSLYFAEVGSDADVIEKLDKWLPDLNGAAVIELTGNADPQGIWLFSGERNRDRSKHWAYDPEKIGQDPEHCMPRITADRFRALKLASPVVWSGACHTAATHRVFVENDIVSTFGRTEKTTVFSMPPEQSIGLALIDAGAVAFLAPVGPNHGFSTLNEQEFALENGASLGEALKSTYDDVFLATSGNPVLPRFVEGKPQPDETNIMAAGGANRLLIGDPSLRPFKSTARKGEETVIENVTKDGFDAVVKWDNGFHALGWDMYGGNRPPQRDWRVYTRIDLDHIASPFVLTPGTVFNTSVEAEDGNGAPLDYRLAHIASEDDRGRHYLHVQADVARKDVEKKAVVVRFKVYQAP